MSVHFPIIFSTLIDDPIGNCLILAYIDVYFTRWMERRFPVSPWCNSKVTFIWNMSSLQPKQFSLEPIDDWSQSWNSRCSLNFRLVIVKCQRNDKYTGNQDTSNFILCGVQKPSAQMLICRVNLQNSCIMSNLVPLTFGFSIIRQLKIAYSFDSLMCRCQPVTLRWYAACCCCCCLLAHRSASHCRRHANALHAIDIQSLQSDCLPS